jgi:uncharacterized protein (DUF58 family)
MFRRNTLSALVTLLLIALVLRQGLLALLLLLLLLATGMAALWSRWALRRVSYERTLSHTHAFVGDEVELTIRIANRKLLPLASLHVRERVPAALELAGVAMQPADRRSTRILSRTTAMRWYERVVWRYRVRCPARGAFRFGPVQLLSGDPFGIFDTSESPSDFASLVIYPKLLPLEELGLLANAPLGDVRAGQLFRDPLRIVGVRDYHPDDPLKDVHWAATARTGALQTRVYEATTSRSVAIFLDLDTFERYYEGIDSAQGERLISAAATLAQRLLAEGSAVGLYVNGAPAEFEHLVRLPPGRSPAQLELIMETLARLTLYSVTSMGRLMGLAAADLPVGATLLLVSAIAPDATRAALLRARAGGRRVVWLYLGEGAPPRLPGVTVRHAPPRGDWRRPTATMRAER